MSMGILAGALGVSLVGGGTWAAFNDVEVVNNTLAAGTLDLVVGEEVVFDISNLKPGDYFTRTLTLTNNGSLDIDEILLTSSSDGWDDVTHANLPDGGVNTKEQFLSQFEVTVDGYGTFNLNNLSSLTNQTISGDGTGGAALIEAGQSASFDITITFKDDPTKYADSRLYEQNKYQGEAVSLQLKFEATQMPGEDRSNDLP